MGSGEEGHQSPKYFRCLGDLGLSDSVVLVPTEWAQLHSQLAKGSAELAGKLDGTGQAGGAWQSPFPAGRR